MVQNATNIRPLAGVRTLLTILCCAIFSVSCSSISKHAGSFLGQPQAKTGTSQDNDTALYAPASPAQKQAAGANADNSRHEPLDFERLSAEQQSDFQYLYNPDNVEPYQRVLAVSRGALGMAQLTPPTDPGQDLWLRIRNGFQLDTSQQDPRLQEQLDWYIAHQDYIDRVVERAHRYMYYIVQELEQRNMPMELALLPVVESAFQPFAYSHSRASGLWQFIPSTGSMYGLHQDWWYDGRRDVIASTHAALNYLQNLADMFNGDWLLALAAYNAGAGSVIRAVRYNEQRNLPTDFWHLKLPRETSAYVPKLLAIAKIVKHPEDYDVTLEPLENKPYFEVVDIGSQIDLAQAAELADVDLDEIYHLNPAFNQWATSPVGPHRLLVPKENADSFRQALAQVPPDHRLTWTRYTVARGDSLLSIARRYRTTPDVLRQVNRLPNNLIRVRQKLLIPHSRVPLKGAQLASASSVPSAQTISLPRSVTRNSDSRIEYRVKPGDTLWDIARAHQVNARQLANWNKLEADDVLQPGQTLVIWTKSDTTVASLGGGQDRRIIRKVGYRVRSGDSLYRIASKFNVSVNDIAKWNNINKKHPLQPGQRLNLMVDITRTN